MRKNFAFLALLMYNLCKWVQSKRLAFARCFIRESIKKETYYEKDQRFICWKQLYVF